MIFECGSARPSFMVGFSPHSGNKSRQGRAISGNDLGAPFPGLEHLTETAQVALGGVGRCMLLGSRRIFLPGLGQAIGGGD